MSIPWERVTDPADPARCQAVLPNVGQCLNKAVPGTPNCACHGGASQANQLEQKSISMYRLKKYQARLTEFSEAEKIKSLRDEIGILRILMEERLNLCTDDLHLMMHTPILMDLATRVEKLVTSCNRLEGQLGVMLDKTQALQIGAEVVEIVGNYVTDEEILTQISNDIAQSIARLGTPRHDRSL